MKLIETHKAVIGVIGLGYVGLPLAIAFARRFQVYGFDVRPDLDRQLTNGNGTFGGVDRSTIKRALHTNFTPTRDAAALAKCDFILVAVGTPLGENKEPDLTQVESAAQTIASRLRRGQFVILESTSYPGTTEEVFLPSLEASGLRAGRDFAVGYSPERIDPGNQSYRVEHIPKLVSGLDREALEVVARLYGEVFHSVVRVESVRIAEAAKILENIFRSVNIALINEIALIMERLGIDAWDVIAAASTKPFGYMPFYPGPGVGGHCIPLDPHYLAYRARRAGYVARFIELSASVNEFMAYHTMELLRRGIGEGGKRPLGCKIAVLGLAFKKDVADTRESPSRRIIEECVRQGMRVRVFDPHARRIETKVGRYESKSTAEVTLKGADGALILTDHSEFLGLDYDHLASLMRKPPIWVDARNVLDRAPKGSIALGIGRPFGRIPDGASIKIRRPYVTSRSST